MGRPTPSIVPIALLRAMRPGNWVKNLPCLAGLVFSGQLFLPAAQAMAALAFATFSLMASAGYLLNDVVDRERDRANPRTAGRPVATGELPVWIAVAASIVLAACAASLASYLGVNCLIVLIAYAALTALYSLRLKRTVIVDVMCVALGFVLRVLFGVYALRVLPTPWIILCMFFLALLVGFGKRKAELTNLGDGAESARPVLRKYSSSYLDLVLGMMATLTILTYTLYCVAPHHTQSLIITILPVVYCVLRYTYKLMVEGGGESPEGVFLHDPMLWLGVLMWLALNIVVLYGQFRFVADFAFDLGTHANG
ncbi:MAG: decaprenyl-phosphate phosphoribosyltransferase [Gemmataceae bacterium]